MGRKCRKSQKFYQKQLPIAMKKHAGLLLTAMMLYCDPYLHHLIRPYRLVHEYRSSPHPRSPHVPPRRFITGESIRELTENGFVVLRDLFTESLLQKMSVAYDDLAANQTRMCAVSKWAGPPTFGRHDVWCTMPDLVHDYLRDSVYHSPMAHAASQLMSNRSVRLYRMHAMGANTDTTLPESWHVDYTYFPGTGACDNGLVFWVPLESSVPESNGMKFLKSSAFRKIVETGSFSSWFTKPADFIVWMSRLGREGEAAGKVQAPKLNFGDAIVFSKCTVHSTSGLNTLRRARRSLQFRLVVEPSAASALFSDMAGPAAGMYGDSGLYGHGSTPLLWPHTLPSEDEVRANGPRALSVFSLLQVRLRSKWFKHWMLMNYVYFTNVFLWKFGLDVNITQVAEMAGRVRSSLNL